VALTLRMVGGLTVAEIARAFLVQETAMGLRITRAKAKIKAARVPYRVPSAEDLPARVSGVLAVLFLVFDEGYLATGPDTDPLRHDLTAEATEAPAGRSRRHVRTEPLGAAQGVSSSRILGSICAPALTRMCDVLCLGMPQGPQRSETRQPRPPRWDGR
jgi:hypothetical protein